MFDPAELIEPPAAQPAPVAPRLVGIEPLTAAAFAPFGNVIEATGTPDRLVDRGRCGRYDDRARLDFDGGTAAVNVLMSEPRVLPIKLNMVLRHRDTSKCVMPMTANPFLVIVAPQNGARPGPPRAFLSRPGQGVNYLRGVWHHILTPLSDPGLFCVIDRADAAAEQEEHWFDRPYTIVAPAEAA